MFQAWAEFWDQRKEIKKTPSFHDIGRLVSNFLWISFALQSILNSKAIFYRYLCYCFHGGWSCSAHLEHIFFRLHLVFCSISLFNQFFERFWALFSTQKKKSPLKNEIQYTIETFFELKVFSVYAPWTSGVENTIFQGK